MKLEELYALKRMNYQINQVIEQPDKLLAMLLLQKKENFKPYVVDEGQFYKIYKKEIDDQIKKVEMDFQLTREYYIQLIQKKGLYVDLSKDEKYEHYKIWQIFWEGFGSMHWGILYHKDNMSAERMYLEYFDDEIGLEYNMCKKILFKEQNEPQTLESKRNTDTSISQKRLKKAYKKMYLGCYNINQKLDN